MRRILQIFLAILALSPLALAQIKSSATLTQTVSAAPAIAAKVTLTSTPNPSTAVQTVTYNGTVSGINNGAIPTGNVIVTDGTANVATVALSPTGTYTCTESGMAIGSHTITATYNGDSNFF